MLYGLSIMEWVIVVAGRRTKKRRDMGRAGVLARQWEYADGHWRAVLPSVDEQMRRGLHSRAVSHRRRSSRCRRAK